VTKSIKLTDVARFYIAKPHQVAALAYLQTQIPAEALNRFAELWRNDPAPIISMHQATAIFGRSPTSLQLFDLNACLERFEINTTLRMRHFLAQVGHESGGLRHTKEIDPGWYIRKKFKLPMVVDVDGKYMYRGAGWLQMSMPENYLAFANYMGDPKIYDLGCPYVAETYPGTASGFWWMINGMNARCDRGDSVEQISRMVNLGGGAGEINGLSDRIAYYARASAVLG